MSWLSLPGFWKGFLVGGITIPVVIVLVEIVVKYLAFGKIFWK